MAAHMCISGARTIGSHQCHSCFHTTQTPPHGPHNHNTKRPLTPQGLHDVASVLLLVAGERAAYAILCRLVTGPLRDATRPTLDPVLELLGLMGPLMEVSGRHCLLWVALCVATSKNPAQQLDLLHHCKAVRFYSLICVNWLSASQVADPELAALARDVDLPPYYALSWFITWFSHDVGGLEAAARLFDLFLAVHPLMPLYVGAVAMRSQRRALLAAGRGEGGMPALHSALTNLDVTRSLSADQLACQVGGGRRACLIKLLRFGGGWQLLRWSIHFSTPPSSCALTRHVRKHIPHTQAIQLYRTVSPEAMLARRAIRIEMAVAPRAFKDR